jgi:hypothetical protein
VTRRTPLALAALALSSLLVSCGGDAPDRKDPLPSESVDLGSPTAKPTPKPTVSASVSKSPSASPTPTGPPPVTGDPMAATGAYLRLRNSDDAVNPAACEEAYPELLDVSCDDFRLDAGGVLWVAGTQDAGGGERQWVLKLHTFVPSVGGYVLRYEAVDPEGTWRGFRLLPARLTGFGVDAVVVQVLFDSSNSHRGYDVLTWRKGGPLALRAHRAELPGMRVVVKDLVLEEYSATAGNGNYAHRRVRWDGTRFRIQTIGPVAPANVPPAS